MLKSKEKFKRNKGITLIALVITIIVLLILAGVTIAMLMGDNRNFNKSKSVKCRKYAWDCKRSYIISI